MSDDANALAKIASNNRGERNSWYPVLHWTVETGRGYYWVYVWLGTIDCDLGKEKPNKCRTILRHVRLAWTPFDSLDEALLNAEHKNPLRVKDNIVGYFGLALELVMANPSLTLSTHEEEELVRLMQIATCIRFALIGGGNKVLLGLDAIGSTESEST